MIENFNSEVNSKLESDEIIEKSFEAKNYEMLERIPDIGLGGYAFMTTENYSFKYSFVITNKRVFVGNMNPLNKFLSYNIYNREDIININDFKDKKKASLRYIRYIGGLSTLLIGIFMLLSSFLPNSDKRIIALISAFLSMGLIYILFKALNKFAKSNNLVKEISLRDGKKLTIILNDSSVLDPLKTQN